MAWDLTESMKYDKIYGKMFLFFFHTNNIQLNNYASLNILHKKNSSKFSKRR